MAGEEVGGVAGGPAGAAWVLMTNVARAATIENTSMIRTYFMLKILSTIRPGSVYSTLESSNPLLADNRVLSGAEYEKPGQMPGRTRLAYLVCSSLRT